MGLRSFAFGMAFGAGAVLGGQYWMATNGTEMSPAETIDDILEQVMPGGSDASEAPAGRPEPSSQGRTTQRFSGEASYYAESLDGNPTASGEPYRHNAFTAAHRTLPFGTRVRVTRRDTGQSVVVTINDRGPYAHNRVIDLSGAAAERLDMDKVGVTTVDVEVLSD
ncbi:MAG: septal ring lytic transglycosylase RlpA family protein [Pseudomonadota bacterium]